MATRLPPAPDFGAPLPIHPSGEALALLAHRRSSAAAFLRAPGPDDEQLMELLRLAARAPDHGKLSPWRFVIMQGQPKAALVERLRAMATAQPNPDKAVAALAKLAEPPVSVMVVSSPKPGQIPLWEQELSAGAVCALFLVAAEAMGFGANWITDWYAYDPAAVEVLGLAQGERVAGFIHIGTPEAAPLERDRPDLDRIVSRL